MLLGHYDVGSDSQSNAALPSKYNATGRDYDIILNSHYTADITSLMFQCKVGMKGHSFYCLSQ